MNALEICGRLLTAWKEREQLQNVHKGKMYTQSAQKDSFSLIGKIEDVHVAKQRVDYGHYLLE